MYLPKIRSVKVLFLILFTIPLTPTFALSQETSIWTNGYHKKLGRLEKKENGAYNIYNSGSKGKPVGRWEDGKVYDRGSYGGKVIGVSESKDGAAYFLLIEGGLLENDWTKRGWNE
jgi:hypothetical protein